VKTNDTDERALRLLSHHRFDAVKRKAIKRKEAKEKLKKKNFPLPLHS